MKILVTFFITFFLTSVFADDISNFEIEKFSIGQNLLNILEKEKIYDEIKINAYMYDYLIEPNKYGEIYLREGLQKYEIVSFFVSTLGNKFINKKDIVIEGLTGTVEFNNINNCLKQRDKIESQFEKLFINYEKFENSYLHPIDPSGKSKVDEVNYHLISGDYAQLQCYDFEESLRKKNNWIDGLTISLYRKKIFQWLSNHK